MAARELLRDADGLAVDHRVRAAAALAGARVPRVARRTWRARRPRIRGEPQAVLAVHAPRGVHVLARVEVERGLLGVVDAVRCVVAVVLVARVELDVHAGRDDEELGGHQGELGGEREEAGVQRRLGLGLLERFAVVVVCVGKDPPQAASERGKVACGRRGDRQPGGT